MSSISIRRPHNLTHAQAVGIAERISDRLSKEYGIGTEWAGKSLMVKGKGLSGELQVAPKEFKLQLTLGFVLSMFRDKIAAGIEAEFDKSLRTKPKK